MADIILADTEVKREFIFATYSRSRYDKSQDILAVKEHLHMPDGTVKPNFRLIKNYQRKFYVTKPSLATHNDKREFEYIENLNEYTTTQANMPRDVYRALNGYYPKGYVSLYDMSDSPYLYGSFVTTPVLLAQDYKTRWPGLVSDYSLAVMDYETEEVYGTKEIISGVISMKNRMHIAVTRDFLGPHAPTGKTDIVAICNKYLGEYVKARNINITVDIVERPADVVISVFRCAHRWSPDILGFWNISFDIEKVISALEKAHIDPAQVFSDPGIPDEFKSFRWHKANPNKLTADGKRTIKHNSDLLHSVTAPSSFYCLCLMFLFKRVRSQKEQQRNSYALDEILRTELNLGKLRFESAADGLIKLEWHIEMQKNHKLEYMAYMAFDAISVELLDEKTHDVSKAFKANTGISEVSKMASNPKRLSDDLHFILEKEGKISCAVGKTMEERFDSLTPSKNGWIITLAPELEYKIGRNLINEYPNLETNITVYCYDIDIKSSYPTSEIILNVSKGTRVLELCKIDGFTIHQTRSIGINLTAVPTNGLSLAQMTYGFPQLNTLLTEFKQKNNI